MCAKDKTIIWIFTTLFFLAFIGCRSDIPTRTDLQLGTQPPANTSSSQAQNPTAVESAIALSDKYAKLSEEAAALRQTKQTLETENAQLKTDLNNCRQQLEQMQKELTQANDILVQTRLELNNWKNDVLGFRSEMREAQKVQLETLYKILKLMGGEVKTEGPEGNQQAQ